MDKDIKEFIKDLRDWRVESFEHQIRDAEKEIRFLKRILKQILKKLEMEDISELLGAYYI